MTKKFILALVLFALPLAAQFTTYHNFVYPYGWNGLDDITVTALTIDGTTTTRSALFNLYGQACRVKAAYVSITSITSSQSLTATIEDPATTGLADGSADATDDEASPTVGVNVFTFSTSTLKAAGTRFFLVIGWTSTQGTIALGGANGGVRSLANYYDYSVAATTKDTSNEMYAALGCDDDNNGTVDRIIGAPNRPRLFPQQALRVFKSDDAVDEYGAIFTFTDNVRAVGACYSGDTANNDAATFEIDVSALSSGTSSCAGGDGCATTTMLDEDWRREVGTSSVNTACLPFDETITLNGGTSYVVSWRATSTTASNSELIYADFGAGNDALLQAMGSGGSASRADEGSWTSGASACWSGGPNCDDIAFAISLVLTGIEEPGAGGGGTVSYGSVQ